MRIRRQLDVFDDGPPEWGASMQAVQEATRRPSFQQTMAANAILGPDGQPGPFRDRATGRRHRPGRSTPQLPIDDMPEAAKIRFREMSRFMAGSKYEALMEPPEWCARSSPSCRRRR
jgi:hypothetical protein